MDIPTISLQHFDNLLHNGIQQATRLIDVLKKEYQSLQHIDPTQLEILTQRKQQLLDELQAFAKSQDLLLKNMGYSANREGLENYLHNSGDQLRITQRWNDLQDLLKKCQKQNKINSAVITISKRQTTNALDLLYGLAAGTKTYGPTGESQSERQSNSLGKA
jgi:flagella synthesis protein FlgN